MVADERSGTLPLRSVDFLLSLLFVETLSLLGVPSRFLSRSVELRFSFGDSRFPSGLDNLDEESVRFFLELDDDEPLSRSVSSSGLFSRGASDCSDFLSASASFFSEEEEDEGPLV